MRALLEKYRPMERMNIVTPVPVGEPRWLLAGR
jgi:hypothetical protein